MSKFLYARLDNKHSNGVISINCDYPFKYFPYFMTFAGSVLKFVRTPISFNHSIYLSYTECIVDTEDGNCGLRLSLYPLDSLFPKEEK